MKKYLAAFALAAAFAQPAAAITFPTLTTIYVGSEVRDDSSDSFEGIATAFHCTNVSGQTATVRILALFAAGNVAGSVSTTLAHGETKTVSTHETTVFVEAAEVAPGVFLQQGAVNIEPTQSAVFCTAMMVEAAPFVPQGIDLHLVRVNPHPGTVE